MEVQFRAYRSDDLEAMYMLDVVCFDRRFRFTRRSMQDFAEAENARVLIAAVDQTIAGFMIVHAEAVGGANVGYVVTLDVAPEHRRRGIARALMQQAETLLRGERCAAMVLHVFIGNDSAMRFYARMGFERSYREKDFYGAGMDAWFLQKALTC